MKRIKNAQTKGAVTDINCEDVKIANVIIRVLNLGRR